MLKSLAHLFFPEACKACDDELQSGEYILCTSCHLQMPLTDFHTYNDESIQKVFYGRLTIENATALLYFEKKGPVQQLMHNLKYRGAVSISNYLGNWLGEDLKDSAAYTSVDVVVPVPIHPKKKKIRGYNQVEGFGKALSQQLQASYEDTILLKSKNTKTQVFKGRFTRSDETLNAFYIEHFEELSGKHILLCDDILTTGATIEACALQLLNIPNIRLSIAVMAIAQ